jgi:conjugative transfer signal peptidase TraF
MASSAKDHDMRKHPTACAPLAFAALGVACVTLPAVTAMPTRLIWNVSESVPLGLYVVTTGRPIQRGTVVAVAPPPTLARFTAERGYLGPGAPMLKTVAALAQDKVCRRGVKISVNGSVIARAKKRDSKGRDLPVWRGCHRLTQGEIFLVNSGVADSMDGRYFGVLPRSIVIGKAHLLFQSGETQ